MCNVIRVNPVMYRITLRLGKHYAGPVQSYPCIDYSPERSAPVTPLSRNRVYPPGFARLMHCHYNGELSRVNHDLAQGGYPAGIDTGADTMLPPALPGLFILNVVRVNPMVFFVLHCSAYGLPG
jgi:hypothetical protein